MAISERPIDYRHYHKIMVSHFTELYNKTLETYNENIIEIDRLRELIGNNLETYKKDYKIDLTKYDDFINNTYTNDTLYKLAKGAYLNRSNNYILTSDLYDLFKYAKLLKTNGELKHNLELYATCKKLNCNEYGAILRKFYFEVHRRMVVNGEGYVFSGGIGWTCINRVKIVDPKRGKRKKIIDFAATKKREKELLAQGKKLFNKEEAEWCAKNGIEYIAEDKRVYKNDEYLYEIPLLDSKLPSGNDLELTRVNYRSLDTRNKTYEDLLNETDRDLTKICALNLDLKSKISLCTEADKLLYTKFIRNENQTSYNLRKTNSKD